MENPPQAGHQEMWLPVPLFHALAMTLAKLPGALFLLMLHLHDSALPLPTKTTLSLSCLHQPNLPDLTTHSLLKYPRYSLYAYHIAEIARQDHQIQTLCQIKSSLLTLNPVDFLDIFDMTEKHGL